jgi:hypothetical protein
MQLLIHSLLSYALPLVVGFVGGLLGQSIVRHRWAHLPLCLIAIVASVLLQYAAFLVFSSVITGNWPTSMMPGELIYALMWFAIPAVFTCVPMTVGGYFGGSAISVVRSASQR